MINIYTATNKVPSAWSIWQDGRCGASAPLHMNASNAISARKCHESTPKHTLSCLSYSQIADREGVALYIYSPPLITSLHGYQKSLGIFGNFTHRTLRNRASTDFLLGLAYLQDQFASGLTRNTTVRNFSIFDSFTNIYVPLGPL